MKKCFKKLSKKVNIVFLAMVMLFNTFAPYMVRADELSVGKIRNPENPTEYSDQVEVIEGNYSQPGDVQVKKIVRKSGNNGNYEIEFQVRGYPYTNEKNAYIVLVFDRSGSMICDNTAWSHEVSNENGNNTYRAADGQVVACMNGSGTRYIPTAFTRSKWTSAVSGGVAFSTKILQRISTAHLGLVTFANNVSDATASGANNNTFVTTPFAAASFGHPYDGTNLSGAIDKAQAKLASVGSNNSEKFMVIIGDGEPNPGTGTATQTSATNAKNAGTTIYTIGYQVGSGSTAETTLKNIASGASNYYPATSEESLEPIFTAIANKIKESFDAGSTPAVNDGLGSAFSVTSTGATNINLNSNISITSTWQSIGKQTITINQDAPDNNGGWKDTNTSFTLTYKDADGNTKTINSTKASPQVYWPQNTYSYSIRFYYENLNGEYVEDTSLKKTYENILRYNSGDIEEEVLLHLNVPIEVSNTVDINDATHKKIGYEVNNSMSILEGNIKNNAANELKVYYKLLDLQYKVNHNIQNASDSDEYTLKESETKDIKYGNTATYSSKTYDGYTYNSGKDSYNKETLTVTDNELIINLYYDIKKFDYEIIYHYEGLDETEKDSGTVDFGTKINVSDEMVTNHNKDGYKLKEENPFSPSREITIGSGTNKIDVYYEKRTDLGYTVNYYEKDTTTKVADSKEVGNQTFGASITEEAIDVNGYNKVEPTSATITIQTEGNVINFYYEKRTDLSYTVNYYEKDTTTKVADSKEVGNQTFGASITEEAIDVDGYNKVEPTSATITIQTEGNVINFYYEKRTDLSYTVNYYEKDTTTKVADSKEVGNQTFGASITEEAIDVNGYNKVEPTSATITIQTEGNVINFYYEKANYNYTVEYYYEDLTQNKFVKDNSLTETIQKKYLDEISTYTNNVNANNHKGYELDHVTTKSDESGSLPLIISYEESENIIRVYYKLKVCSYSINYYYDGTKEWSETINNQKYGVIVSDYDYRDKTGTIITLEELNNSGYEFSGAKVNIEVRDFDQLVVGEDSSIDVYYISRSDLGYKVNYLEKDTEIVLAKQKVVENQTFGSVITETAIDIDGYEKVEPTSKDVVITVEENVVTFYYIKRTDLSYIVNYYDKDTNEVIKTAKTVSNQKFGKTVNATDEVVAINGYNYDSANPETITITTGENIINLYYVKRNDLNYTVNYYEKGTTTKVADSKEVGNQTFGASITEEAIDVDGYNKVEPTSATITIQTEGNVINFYYEKRTDLSYTVNYLDKETGDSIKEPKTVDNQTFGTVIYSDDEIIDIDNYTYDSADKESITIGTKERENVINLYYNVNKSDIIVHYVIRNVDDGTLTSFKDFAVDIDGNVMEPFIGLDLEDETSTGVVGSEYILNGRMPTDFVFVGIYENDLVLSTEETYLVNYGEETREFTYVYEAPTGDGPPQTGVENASESIIFRVLSLIILVGSGLYTIVFRKRED